MTASLRKLGAGRDAGLYYTNNSAREAKPDRRDEYYARDGDGVWWSTGQTVVRHGAQIDVGSFRDLCAGIDPQTGKALVRGAGAGHWAGLDLTLTPGKSVSILWMAGTPEQRAIIETAHHRAVDRALQFLIDEGLIVVRQGAGGFEKARPTDVIVGQYTHFTTRAGDPNIHTYCVSINVAGAPDGGAGRYAYWHLTTEPERLFVWQKVAGAAFRAAYAQCLAEVGLTPRPAGRGQWEVAGVDDVLIETFSKRSKQMEEIVGRDASGAQKEIAALRTRASKQELPTGEQLEKRWREELAQTGADPWPAARRAEVHRAVARERLEEREREQFVDPPEIDDPRAVASAASTLFRHGSVIDRRGLLEAALFEAALQKLGPDQVYDQIAALEREGKLVPLTRDAWTTPSIAACEASLLRAADRPQERAWFIPEALDAALARAAHLSPEQREAVAEAARSDGVSVIEAGAGTGKTTLACAIVNSAHASGLKVVGLAPSWVAADELARSTGVEASAVAKWRYELQAEKRQPLDRQTLVLIDEAGMAGTREMEAVLAAAKVAGAKVVLIGDRRQLESVAGAGALKAVAEVVRRGAVLGQVRRQTVDWQKAASVLMARGDAEAGLRGYAAENRIELVPGGTAAQERTIAIWTDLRRSHGEDVLIMTRRNSDSAELNRAARAVLKGEGRIVGPELKLPALDREDEPTSLALAEGDLVRFSENLPRSGIRNGTRATIVAIEQNQEIGVPRIAFRLEDGREIVGAWSSFARERPSKKLCRRGLCMPMPVRSMRLKGARPPQRFCTSPGQQTRAKFMSASRAIFMTPAWSSRASVSMRNAGSAKPIIGFNRPSRPCSNGFSAKRGSITKRPMSLTMSPIAQSSCEPARSTQLRARQSRRRLRGASSPRALCEKP